MKIVIISRIVYPKNSPRAFRTTELATELARQGHEVVVYAVTGGYDYSQFTKETHVQVKNIPMFFSTSGSYGEKRYNIFDKIAFHLLHKVIEYPDIEFVWKVPSILKKEKNIDALITIAVPHPIHWGTAVYRKFWQKKNKNSFTWIADCGDPYYGDSVKKRPFYFKWVEIFWGKYVDYVTIPIESAKIAYKTIPSDKIRVIPQGFNFSKVTVDESFSGNDIPHFAYAGFVYPGYRDPTAFLKYLKTLKQDFRFIIYTRTPLFYATFVSDLKEKLIIRSYIPREDLIKELSYMDFLINLKNPSNRQSPSKLIDYFLTKRPILDISTEFSEQSAFEQFINKNYSSQHKVPDISIYDIQNVVKQFLSLM